MNLTIEIDREQDGRLIAEVPDLSGVMVYGRTREQATARVQALALRVLAALLRIGWSVKRQSSSTAHCPDPVGPIMSSLSPIGKRSGRECWHVSPKERDSHPRISRSTPID